MARSYRQAPSCQGSAVLSCRFHPALLALLFAAPPALAAESWTAKRFEIPERVPFDREGGRLFVSSIVGPPDAKDGDGHIAVLASTARWSRPASPRAWTPPRAWS
jgi:hypothetical protein